MTLVEATNDWWGLCARPSPGVPWCRTHECRFDLTKDTCNHWNEYYAFAQRIVSEWRATSA